MIKIEEFKSGTYRNQGSFKSFLPSKINDIWSWDSPEINSLLSKAYMYLGSLDGYSSLIPNVDVYIKMHIQVEANRSNKIEGTKTTIEEDLASESAFVSIEKRDDIAEVNNYICAINYGIKRIKDDDFPLSSRLIREIHSILLKGVRGEHKTPGEFRRSQNFIGGSMPSNALYVPPAVCDLDDLMNDFDKFMNNQDNLPSLIKIAIMHYQFETIHPFLDGNGRIGRLLIPLFLLSRKELNKPCFYISNYFEKNRSEYYTLLQNVRMKNNMKDWICFFLKASVETAKGAKDKFSKVIDIVREYEDYLKSKRTSSVLSKILNEMYSKPIIGINQLSKKTGLSVQGINKAMHVLLDDKIVSEITGAKRNRIFKLDKYFSTFASE